MAAVLVVFCGCAKKEKAAEAPVDTEDMFQEAVQAVENGEFDEGMKLFNKMIEIDPDNPKPHCGIGTIYREQGKFQQAVEKYEKAIELDPKYGICMNNLGATYIAMKEYEKAEEILKKALEVQPDYSDPHYTLALVYKETARNDEAITEFETYVETGKNEQYVSEAKTNIEQLKAAQAR